MTYKAEQEECARLDALIQRLATFTRSTPQGQLSVAAAKYFDVCQELGKRPDPRFVRNIQNNVFDLDVSRFEHGGPDDVLGAHLKVLTSTTEWRYIRLLDHSIQPIDVNSKAGPLDTKHAVVTVDNKRTVGSRLMVALCKLSSGRRCQEVEDDRED